MKILFVIIAAFLLSGCFPKAPRDVNIRSTPVATPELILPAVDQLRQLKENYIIINKGNATKILTRHNGIMWALSEQDYKNMVLNNRNKLKILEQKDAVIDAYKKYYSNVNKKPIQTSKP